MNCPGIDPHNPYFWITLSAFFLGAAAAEASIIPRFRPDPEKARKWKWFWFYIFCTVFLVLGVTGFFLAGPKQFLQVRLAVYGGGVFFFSAAGFRFKKTAGALFALLILSLFLYLSLIFHSWQCTRGDEEIASFRVLSADSASLEIELQAEGEKSIITLPGNTVSVQMTAVYMDQFYIIRGGAVFFRFRGLTSSTAAAPKQSYPKIEKASSRLPGITMIAPEKMGAQDFLPELFERYRIFLSGGGRLTIVPDS